MPLAKKPRAKSEKKIKFGEAKCLQCDNPAELSPPGSYCSECRMMLAEKTRVSYNEWKKSRGLPVYSKSEEIERAKIMF